MNELRRGEVAQVFEVNIIQEKRQSYYTLNFEGCSWLLGVVCDIMKRSERMKY